MDYQMKLNIIVPVIFTEQIFIATGGRHIPFVKEKILRDYSKWLYACILIMNGRMVPYKYKEKSAVCSQWSHM